MNNNEKCSEIAVRNLWPAVYRMILQNEPNLGYGHINYEFSTTANKQRLL